MLRNPPHRPGPARPAPPSLSASGRWAGYLEERTRVLTAAGYVAPVAGALFQESATSR
jgi:hypothetical protein